MIEKQEDLWAPGAHAYCITTNGTIKMNGAGVMGRGCAKQALQRYPGLDRKLGQHLRDRGNVVFPLLEDPTIVVFPVKHAWHEPADLTLIIQSAYTLMDLTTRRGWRYVRLPRPGCGNGQRSWEREVRPLLEPVLDDRIVVVYQ